MVERINTLKYVPPERTSTKEPLESNLFLTAPAEFLVKTFVAELKADPAWARLFGDQIEEYDRMDISMRTLPAMRVYFERWRKDYESWYETGDLKIDIIWPASIRRGNLQRLPSTIAGAMMQQLRRTNFFVSLCAKNPGLNELGKNVKADMTLGFQWQDELVPMTRITANFRINLADWDDYLESDYRTKDQPFLRTLADLKRLRGLIDGVTGAAASPVEIEIGYDIGFGTGDVPVPPVTTLYFGFSGGPAPETIGGFGVGQFKEAS